MLLMSLMNIDTKSFPSMPQPQELKDRYTVSNNNTSFTYCTNVKATRITTMLPLLILSKEISSLALGLANAMS
jgi:hypothetical protein